MICSSYLNSMKKLSYSQRIDKEKIEKSVSLLLIFSKEAENEKQRTHSKSRSSTV